MAGASRLYFDDGTAVPAKKPVAAPLAPAVPQHPVAVPAPAPEIVPTPTPSPAPTQVSTPAAPLSPLAALALANAPVAPAPSTQGQAIPRPGKPTLAEDVPPPPTLPVLPPPAAPVPPPALPPALPPAQAQPIPQPGRPLVDVGDNTVIPAPPVAAPVAAPPVAAVPAPALPLPPGDIPPPAAPQIPAGEGDAVGPIAPIPPPPPPLSTGQILALLNGDDTPLTAPTLPPPPPALPLPPGAIPQPGAPQIPSGEGDAVGPIAPAVQVPVTAPLTPGQALTGPVNPPVAPPTPPVDTTPAVPPPPVDTTPAVPPPPPGTTGTGAGTTGDLLSNYEALINGDPAYIKQQGFDMSLLDKGAAAEAALVRQLLLGYGSQTMARSVLAQLAKSDPRLAAAIGNVDDFVNQVDANGNPIISDDPNRSISTLAQLARAFSNENRNVDESYNDKNLFYSGAHAKAAGDLAYGHQVKLGSAYQTLQGALTNAAQAYSTLQDSATQKNIDAYTAAYERLVAEALKYGNSLGTGATDTGAGATNTGDSALTVTTSGATQFTPQELATIKNLPANKPKTTIVAPVKKKTAAGGGGGKLVNA